MLNLNCTKKLTSAFLLYGCETYAGNKSDPKGRLEDLKKSFQEYVWPNKGDWRLAN
jgi:hypothetical protein